MYKIKQEKIREKVTIAIYADIDLLKYQIVKIDNGKESVVIDNIESKEKAEKLYNAYLSMVRL